MKKPYLFFAFIVLSILFFFQAEIFAWEKAKEEKGITIYTRKIEGSNFIELKAVMRVKTSLASLVALFEDIESGPSWIETFKEAKLLERISQTETYTYSVNAAPWPIKDRDAIVHNIIKQDPNSNAIIITATGVPDFIPEKPNLVRIKNINAYWKFTPLEDGYVEIDYRVHNDPGGHLPSWIINYATIFYPYNSMLNLKEIIKKPKYQHVQYDFISKEVSK
ncbi:MAG: START domain-containing protein [bacterium]